MGKSSSEQKKKLSWAYRKKTKLRKIKNSEASSSNCKNTDDNARIIVRNLSFKVTDEDVKRFYEPYGEIKEINLLKHPDGKPIGCGFIQFKHMKDASKAIFNTNKKEFLGRIISSNWAISKSKFCKELDIDKEHDLNENQEIKNQNHPYQDTQKKNEHNKTYRSKQDDLEKHKRRKHQKMKRQKKRARIIIRNLSFEATEDNLKEYFSQYGKIDEIKILTKSDGKRTGCAFVQFNLVQSAAKAIHYANMQTLIDRVIVVDWAVSKSTFSKNNINEIDIKPKIEFESSNEDKMQKTLAKVSCSNDDKANDFDAEHGRYFKEITTENTKIKNESDEDIKYEVKDVDEEENDNDSTNNDSDENEFEKVDEMNEVDNDDSVINKPIEEKNINQEERKNQSDSRHPWISNDINEGKTVFLKNVPFSVKNDELKRYMEQFGPVYYALVCIDSLTEYSKGTAFVKFINVADAEKCLSAELHMHDQIIEVHKALHRNEVENKKNLKEQRIKDSRNLYLIKEGVILAGSPAAAGVSTSDMAKRLKLEQWKSQILRNLNMFVSRIRLVVHNLPSSLDNAKLKQLFKNHSGPKAIITEARVMRDLKNVDATGMGKSKEYGFVTFTIHEDALKALRNINNNPNIFSKSKRPIVGFSIENRIMVNAKKKRIQKSREHNLLWSENTNKRKNENIKEEVPAKRIKIRKLNDSNEKSYTGITGKLGQDKLRSNFNLKSQAELHTRLVKKQNKLSKAIKQSEVMKKERLIRKEDNKQTKQTKRLDADDLNFNKLVNNYRNKLKGIDLKKSKWYETSNES